MDKVGITTTIPMEVVYAAGKVPVDLNNIFITNSNPQALVENAELAGYPRNLCAWIKGIYSTAVQSAEINTIIAVTQGDCSNTHALMETLQLENKKIIPFAFPYDRDYDLLKLQIEKLMEALGTNWDRVYQVKDQLDRVRIKIREIDRCTWEDNKVNGWDNHLFQVSCSDFEGNPEEFEQKVDRYLAQLPGREPLNAGIRLAYIGVPPIVDDLYDYVEERGARIVFNETQRQFAMPFHIEDMVEQYRVYSYPYGIFYRLQDIEAEIERRQVDGVIHYAQSFCYRQIEDLIIRKKLKLPILTLEGDKPNKLDARTRMRVDAFLDILR